MDILILSPFFPYPLTQGGKIRVFNIIKYLSREHRITLACLSEEKITDYGPLKDYCEEVLVTYKMPSTAKNLLRFLTGLAPFNHLRYASREMEQNLANLLRIKSFDLVQVEFSMMWQYAHLFNGTSVILDAHNIEADNVRQIGNISGNPLKRLLYRLEEKRLRQREEQAWKECDLCFAVSDKEREVIVSHRNPAKVFTIHNGVDPVLFEFVPKDKLDKRVLFIGGLEYIPALDSALYLIDEIIPRLKLIMPDICVDIVGRELWRIRDKTTSAGVKFHENVPDVLPYFRRADILVVPLRYGAGTRIKILEAMAAGLPVVTTSKGCEGLQVRHGGHLLIADTPDSFADAVHELYEDTGLREYITKSARHLVEQKYSWEIIVNDIHYENIKIVKSVLNT
jgi:polysaccharide biosynthesis protein PslH